MERKGTMTEKTIRLGIIGYGNLGKGAVLAIRQNPDLALTGIFTRRDPSTIDASSPVYAVSELERFRDAIDVCLLCGGSARDLDRQGPDAVRHFHTVDSFDTHARIPAYYETMDAAARASGHLALISVGWDPGLFSLIRLFEEAVLPVGDTVTFWGKGVSQGHSDAIRQIPGVAAAVQYTIPLDDAIDRVRQGDTLSSRERHRRDCFVVLEDGADAESITQRIVTMPHYFSDYDTTVTFVSREELAARHSGMPHGGRVMRRGQTTPGTHQSIDFSLKLDSNPEFTASILVAAARAVHRMATGGQTGAITLFDVPPGYLSARSAEDLRKSLL